jgi:hypothetical protein
MIGDLTSTFMRHAAEPVTTTPDECMAELRRVYGDKADEKLALAKGLVWQASQKWPRLIEALETHGTGNDPKVIRKLVARAEVLKKQGKL